MLKEDDVVLKDIIETRKNLLFDKRATGLKVKVIVSHLLILILRKVIQI